MKKRNFKGRCEKRDLSKCEGICRTYDPLQAAYALRLSKDPKVRLFRCNVPLEDPCADYMTDFVVEREDGSTAVRECVFRHLLKRPRTIKLLDASQRYWYSQGIYDWKIVVEAREGGEDE